MLQVSSTCVDVFSVFNIATDLKLIFGIFIFIFSGIYNDIKKYLKRDKNLDPDELVNIEKFMKG